MKLLINDANIRFLEEIKSQNKGPIDICISKLNELKNINNRLPEQEIDKRILAWTNEQHVHLTLPLDI